MTPIQIDSMIDRICGMYPTTPVPRNGMKALWREDALLLSMKEVVESLPNCEICNGTGWDDGLRIADGVILHERFTSIDMRGNVCTTVTKCECRK